MKKIFPLLFLFGFLINGVWVLGCQYTEDIYKTETKDVFYDNGEQLDYALIELTDFRQGMGRPYEDNTGASFKVKNNHPTKKVDLEVFFTKNGQQDSVNLSLDPLGYSVPSRLDSDNIDFSSIRYHFLNDEFSVKSQEVKTFVNTTCKNCNDKECLDDGISCSLPYECGGEYCVEGYCSISVLCYNNDCKCSPDEVQCSDNKRCVKKGAVPLDVKPECKRAEECVSGYINTTSNLCAKSPTQLQEEEDRRLKEELDKKEQERIQKEKERILLVYAIITIIIVIVFGIILYKYLKNKGGVIEIEKIKTEIKQIGKKIELLKISTIKLKEQQGKLEQLNIDIHKLEEDKNKSKTQINDYEGKKNEKIKELKSLEKNISENYGILEDIRKRIETNQEELKRIEKERSKSKEQIVEIAKMKEKITNDNEEYSTEVSKLDKLKEEYFKPYPSKDVNRMVWRNPELGLYECFYNKDKPNPKSNELVHIWVWKKHNGRYPRQGYHIHHIDGDKYNNEPRNLEELDGEEHFEMHKRGLD